ncbi:hypothetical protein D7V97_36385 [Corallococcus sp. CA053C]|nr:hypothetical protein D7V97_36385 [Corallococcus sp. CA053C]
MRGGAEHFQSVRGQLPVGRIRQFFYGASLPFHIARTTLKDPPTRERYLRVTALQTAFLLALAAGWVVVTHDDTPTREERSPRVSTPESRARSREAEARIEQRTREVEALLKARGADGEEKVDKAAVAAAVGALIAEAVNAENAGEVTPEEAVSTVGDVASEAGDKPLGAVPPASGEAGAPESVSETQEDEDAAEPTKEDALEPLPGTENLPQPLREEIAAALQEATRDAEEAKGSRIQRELQQKGFNIDAPEVRHGILFLGSWEFWVAFFGSLSVAQWVIVALSRDFHTVISREASLATGVTPEDPEIHPRVRLNFPWMRAKVRRRWRAFVLFAAGFPALAVLTTPVLWNKPVFTTLSTAWGFWWLIVFTAAKSDRAWVAPVTNPPWFFRRWEQLAHALPVLRWGPFNRYLWMWARRTEGVGSPIAAVERQPWAFAGLAATRFVGSLPPFRCFTRPFIPVASAHLLSLDPKQPPVGAVTPPPHSAGD